MTDEELDEMAVDLSHTGELSMLYRCEIADAITTLRAQLAEAHKDGSQLAAWHCLFDDGKTGIVCDDWGNQYCAMQRRADRAEAALAAQIEVDAGICSAWGTLSPADIDDGVKWQFDLPDQIAASIRAQPHDRTALDRMLAEAREKALREAYDSLFKHPGFIHAISGQKFKAVKLEDAAEAILALIEKPVTQGGNIG